MNDVWSSTLNTSKRPIRCRPVFAVARMSAAVSVVPYHELKLSGRSRNFRLSPDQLPPKLAPRRNLPHHTDQYLPKEGPLSELDLVIRGGTVIDGTGRAPVEADIG